VIGVISVGRPCLRERSQRNCANEKQNPSVHLQRLVWFL
jgi:hypothetical protein